MKITISKEELVRGVQIIQSALSTRTTLPILLNFLMETDNKKIKIISTDLEIGVKHYIKAEIETDGSITIPTKKFADILHSLSESQDIELAVDEGEKISLKCGRSRFNIIGALKSNYPVLPEFNKTSSFEIKAGIVAEMIRKTIFSTSSDETRHALNGVFWAAKKGLLEMVSTDGRRLSLYVKRIIPEDKEFSVIVPTKVLSELLKLITLLEIEDKDEDKILIAVTENQINFKLKETTILSRLVSGSFPNYEQFIPKKIDFLFKAPVKDILAVTKRASLCAVDRGGSVKYALKKGSLNVSSLSQNSEFNEDIAVEYEGAEFLVAFNPHFVIDALKHIDTETVSVAMTTSVNSALFEPVGGENEYKFIVMPMRS